MKKFLFLALLFVCACTNESGARSALLKSGFTDIETLGYAPFACGQDDGTSTRFRATNSQGIRVEGVVCCGLVVKNCTVRF